MIWQIKKQFTFEWNHEYKETGSPNSAQSSVRNVVTNDGDKECVRSYIEHSVPRYEQHFLETFR